MEVARTLAIGPAKAVNVASLGIVVRDQLRRHVVAFVRDPLRGLDRIEHEVAAGEHFYLGYAGVTLRLLVGLAVDRSSRTATISLRATKGTRDALEHTDWGDHGLDVGNSVLVARVFHVGLVTLRAVGVQIIANQPHDPRVRARYVEMGFVDGERLELDDVAALTRAYGFIAEVYAKYGISLIEVPP